MPYWEHRPSPPLQPLIARISHSIDPVAPFAPIRVLPDGCCDLLFSIDLDTGACQAELFGVKSRALIVHDKRPTQKVAVHLRPGVFARLFGIATWELRDRSVPLEEVWPGMGRDLAGRFCEAASWSARKQLLEASICRVWDSHRAPPVSALVDRAVDQIRISGGRASIASIAGKLGVSVRTLERGFHEHVGLTPKILARIVRFRTARQILRAGRRGAEAAATAGYSDQAHMVRDFRLLGGVSPTRL